MGHVTCGENGGRVRVFRLRLMEHFMARRAHKRDL